MFHINAGRNELQLHRIDEVLALGIAFETMPFGTRFESPVVHIVCHLVGIAVFPLLANYLRENGIIPEKCDLNDILFLMTPAETATKMDDLVAKLVRFEKLIDEDAPMSEVLPSIYKAYQDKYKGYTIRRLCQEMHDFYKDREVSTLQKELFLKDYFPKYVMNPQEAQYEFMRGHGELVDLAEAEGRTALEGALPYPPGVICVHAGEAWTKTAVAYFLDLVEGINQLPGFAPEIQGVYVQEGEDGLKHAYGYVLKKEFEK